MGKFVKGDQRTVEAGRKGGNATPSKFTAENAAIHGRAGGKASTGNFAANPLRAREAGRAGGVASAAARAAKKAP